MTDQLNKSDAKCLVCGRNSDQVPLLVLWNQGQNYWICPEHLPILIHQPHRLVGKLPGASELAGGQH